MENQKLGFSTGEADEPRLLEAEGADVLTQAPLTDRETVGFYTAMQEEREKRQVLEKELEILRSGSKTTPAGSIEGDFAATLYASNLRVSRRLAEAEHGRAVVSTLHDWAAAKCDSDPAFNARMRASDDPYEAARKIYDQEQAPTISLNYDTSRIPPRSLADAPGNGAVGKPYVPVGDGNAYESLFK